MLVKYMRMLSLLKRFLWRCTRNVDFAPQRCYVGFKLRLALLPQIMWTSTVSVVDTLRARSESQRAVR